MADVQLNLPHGFGVPHPWAWGALSRQRDVRHAQAALAVELFEGAVDADGLALVLGQGAAGSGHEFDDGIARTVFQSPGAALGAGSISVDAAERAVGGPLFFVDG